MPRLSRIHPLISHVRVHVQYFIWLSHQYVSAAIFLYLSVPSSHEVFFKYMNIFIAFKDSFMVGTLCLLH